MEDREQTQEPEHIDTKPKNLVGMMNEDDGDDNWDDRTEIARLEKKHFGLAKTHGYGPWNYQYYIPHREPVMAPTDYQFSTTLQGSPPRRMREANLNLHTSPLPTKHRKTVEFEGGHAYHFR